MGMEDAHQAWNRGQPAVPVPACFARGRKRELSGSLAIHPMPWPCSKTPAELTGPRHSSPASAAPGPNTPKASAPYDFEANPRLWHPLSTLHERRCRRPCKTRFRLAGCAFTGRGSNPLDDFERFQDLHSVLLSRASPDASWVRSERLVHKLVAFNDRDRAAQQRIRGLIWDYYRDLKAYRDAPSSARRASLRARFDRIFRRTTGFVMLDRLLKRLYANRSELLVVLDRPDIPLHTNGSENDIRSQVTKRKISGGTRSDDGRTCRDAFLGIAKTCAKLGISFWHYLGERLKVANSPDVPYFPDIVFGRSALA